MLGRRIARLLAIGEPYVENGMLEEYTIERTGTQHIVGSIYKGRVRNLEQGLKAMGIEVHLNAPDDKKWDYLRALRMNAMFFWTSATASCAAGQRERSRREP